MKKISLIVIIIFILGIGFFVWKNFMTVTPPTANIQTPSESVVAKDIFAKLNSWTPGKWSEPLRITTQTVYGALTGVQTTSEIISNQIYITHFEDKKFMNDLGFYLDNNLAADKPGGSLWGYRKDKNKKPQIVIYTYENKPTSFPKNAPVQFNCPCSVKLTVFVSNPFSIK